VVDKREYNKTVNRRQIFLENSCLRAILLSVAIMDNVSFIQGYELLKLDLGLQKLTSEILIHRRAGGFCYCITIRGGVGYIELDITYMRLVYYVNNQSKVLNISFVF